MQFLAVGTILLVAFGLAFWLAAPTGRQGSQLSSNDQAQAYYAVALVAALGGGIINVVLGLMA